MLLDRFRRLIEHASQQGRIALSDGNDSRVASAALMLSSETSIFPVLVGRRGAVEDAIGRLGAASADIEIYDPVDHIEQNSELLLSRMAPRSSRINERVTTELAANSVYVAALLASTGNCEAAVAGSVRTTAEVVRAAIRVIGTANGFDRVSSCFLLQVNDRIFAYSDCAVIAEPSAEELADIAISTAATFQHLTGREPRVALLSFSTHGSAEHPSVNRVRAATEIVRCRAPGIMVDGELQFDAAVNPEVALRKSPNSPLSGTANVFVFPNLDAANISYKITQHLAGANAFGPLLQGLAVPMNDLSRSCTSVDVFAVSLASMIQAWTPKNIAIEM